MPPARNSRAAHREAAERAAAERASAAVIEDSRSEGSAPGGNLKKRAAAGNGNGNGNVTGAGINGAVGTGGAIAGVTNSNGTHAHEGIDGVCNCFPSLNQANYSMLISSDRLE